MPDLSFWTPYLILLKGEGDGFSLLAITLAADTCYRPERGFIGLPQGIGDLGPESGNREILKVTLPIGRVDKEPCYRVPTPIAHVLFNLELSDARPTVVAYAIAQGQLKGKATILMKDGRRDRLMPLGPDTPFPWGGDHPFPYNVLAVR